MKKFACLVLVALFAAAAITFVPPSPNAYAEELVLNVYNWEDYIGEDENGVRLDDAFEAYYKKEHPGKDVKVNYLTFGTNEIMYNQLVMNPSAYDLICPSDYMIEKLIRENRLAEIPKLEEGNNFDDFGLPFLQDLFEDKGWDKYAVPYTWGTMGFTYNPKFVTEEEASTWGCVLNEKFKNKTTLKDSVRDTFFLGVALAKLDELTAKNEAFAKGSLDKDAYAKYLADTFNDTSEATLKVVEEKLKQAEKLSFALEVDDGKNDVVTGKIWLNFAWSGDAVFAMDEAENDNVKLNYAVPKEGSNIWYDGWVIPKESKNKELAYEFINFLSLPENAVHTMEAIGYSSAIGGQDVLDWVAETFALEEGEKGVEVNLSHYFPNEEGNIITVAERGRQLDALYPSEDIINRCTIMQCFADADNDRVNDMWNRVKAGDKLWIYIVVIAVVVVLAAIGVVIFLLYKKGVFEKKGKKGFTRVE